MRLPFLDGRRLGQPVADIILEVGGDPLQAADRNRLFFHAATPACRFARPVAGAPEDPGKHVGLPVDHVGVAVAACCDQADVFGNRRVRRTRPLAIHDLVEVVGRRNVGGFHLLLCTHACCAPQNLRDQASAGLRSSSAVRHLGPPNPARIVVERPSEFHRYIRHDGILRPASLSRHSVPQQL